MIKKALESDGLVAARLKLNAEAKVTFYVALIPNNLFGHILFDLFQDALPIFCQLSKKYLCIGS
jgi:hypothetical protein